MFYKESLKIRLNEMLIPAYKKAKEALTNTDMHSI